MEILEEPRTLQVEPWLIVSVALQAMCVGKVLWLSAVRQTAVKRFLSQFWKCRVCLRWPRRQSQSIFTNDEIRLIEAKVLENRLAWVVRINNALLAMWILLITSVQANIMSGRQTAFSSSELIWFLLAPLAFHGAAFLIPSVLSTSTLNVWFLVAMVLVSFSITPAVATLNQVLTGNVFLLGFFRVPCSLACTRIWLAVACNLAPFLVMQLRIWTAFYPADSACDFYISQNTAALNDASNLVIVFLASLAADGFLRNRVTQDILFSKAATELTAASSLLHLTCDAVVELDDDLRMSTPAGELAALLLRDRHTSSLEGKQFTEFMPTQEEATRAEEILRGEGSNQDANPFQEILTNAFHTRLVDSYSSKFRTEVFHVKYTRLGKQTCHLIGLRDFTDRHSLAGRKALDSLESRGHSPELGWFPGLEKSLLTGSKIVSTTDQLSDGVQEVKVDLENKPPGGGQVLDRSPSDLSLASGEQRMVFLQIDMNCSQVVSASVCLSWFAGKFLNELFGPPELGFLQQVWQQVHALDLRNELENKELNFGNLELKWGGSTAVHISGRVEVTKAAEGKLGFLLHFAAPSFAPPAPSHPGVRSIPSSRSSSRSPTRRRSTSQPPGGKTAWLRAGLSL